MSVDLIPGGTAEYCLDQLFDWLAGTGAGGRRALAEAEEHLRDAIESGLADGLSPRAAEAEAVARFGNPADIGAQFLLVHTRFSPRTVLSAVVAVVVVMSFILMIDGSLNNLVDGIF